VEELMTAQELCKLLKVSKPWPYRAAKKGLIPHYRMGNLVRFRRTDVEAYIEKCRVEAREIKVNKNKGKVPSLETKQTPEICRGCFKRTDGRIDYLIDGFCETCRPR
jgi:excisionase family DNA binding protein